MRLRFLLLLLLLVAPAVLADDADTLLTAEGTLYTIEAETESADSGRHLVLTVREGDELSAYKVPGSLSHGDHSRPALARDAESETLFVIWLHSITPSATELVFCSFKDGQWSEATSIDAAGFRLRRNLRVGVTRSVEAADADGKMVLVPGLTVHAVWWEERGSGELARYAMLVIEQGAVSDVTVRDLSSFFEPAEPSTDTDSVAEILKHPILFESQKRETIDVLFGDTSSKQLHRLTLQPRLDGRVRIPIGGKPRLIGAPTLRASVDGKIAAIASGERVAVYTESENAIQFSIYAAGKWGKPRSIALGEKLKVYTALEAMRKMVQSE